MESFSPSNYLSKIFALRKIANIDILEIDLLSKFDYEICVLRGSYGEIKLIYLYDQDKIYVKKRVCIDDGTCLSEILFLRSLYNDFSKKFIPKIISIEIDTRSNSLDLNMSYCGYDLSSYMKPTMTTMEYRIKLIPSFIIQMARFLCWAKKHNIAHMDIKCQNICMCASTGDLYFIDFGFVGPVCGYSSKYCGTYAFAMPNYLTCEKRIKYECDLFSCGITILSFVAGQYMRHEKFTALNEQKYINYVSGSEFKKTFEKLFNPIFEEINSVIGPKYVYLIKKMLYYDKKTQFINVNLPNKMTPEELYYMGKNSIILNNLRQKYPLENALLPHILDIISIPEPISTPIEELNNIIEWLATICTFHNCLYLFKFAIDLLQQYLSKIQYTGQISYLDFIKNIKGYAISCVLIGDYIFNSNSQLKLKSLQYISELVNYSRIQIFNFIIQICEIFDWRIYPKNALFEWNIELDCNWLFIFYIPSENFTIDNYIEMRSTKKQKMKKYVMNKIAKLMTKSIIDQSTKLIIERQTKY